MDYNPYDKTLRQNCIRNSKESLRRKKGKPDFLRRKDENIIFCDIFLNIEFEFYVQFEFS